MANSSVGLTFWDDGSAFACVAAVLLEGVEANGQHRLRLTVPPNLPRFETRTSFRVPILVGVGLVVRWTGGGTTQAVAVLDLGCGGARIELPVDHAAPPVGKTGRVRLSFQALVVDVEGEVRGLEGNHARLMFPESWRGPTFAPPGDLCRLVDEVERVWIKKRSA